MHILGADQFHMEDAKMLIGVCSDIHDNLAGLKTMLSLYKERNVETIIFCGDFCSPIPARLMGSLFDGKIHCVFGNGDGDKFALLNIANSQFENLIFHGEYAVLDFDGVTIAVTHYPFYAEALAKTGDYNAVFYGHNHVASVKKINGCLWLNPGEVLGFKGDCTCAIYNTESNTAEIISI